MRKAVLFIPAIALVILIIFAVSGCSNTSPEAADNDMPNLKTGELKAILDSGKNVTVLDARSGAGTIIPGAKVLPAGSSEKEIFMSIPDKNAEIVTYCSSLSCGASSKLAAKLKSLGYTNVTEYPEGIKGWTESGNKAEKVVK